MQLFSEKTVQTNFNEEKIIMPGTDKIVVFDINIIE
jgi:predicted nucleic-acid-binding Zn-ribbon protein